MLPLRSLRVEGKEGRRLQAAPKTRGRPTRKRVLSSSHTQQFQDSIDLVHFAVVHSMILDPHDHFSLVDMIEHHIAVSLVV
jgi:hypothetical protein